jgi:hypothetical protein
MTKRKPAVAEIAQANAVFRAERHVVKAAEGVADALLEALVEMVKRGPRRRSVATMKVKQFHPLTKAVHELRQSRLLERARRQSRSKP